MLGRFAGNSKALPLATLLAVLKRSYSSSKLNPKYVANMVIRSVANEEPETLFAVLRSQSKEDNTVPEGHFGPGGIYSVSSLHKMLRSSKHFKENTSILKLDELKKEYFNTLLNPDSQEERSNHLMINAFNSVASGHDLETSFVKLVRAQIKNQCNAIPLMTELLLSNKMDPKKVKISRTECISNSRFDLIEYIDLIGCVREFQHAIEEFQKCDPQTDLQRFYKCYGDLSEAEFRLRIFAKRSPEIKPDPRNLSNTHPAIQFYATNPEAISLVDNISIAVNSKKFDDFKQALDAIPPDILAKLTKLQTQTISGRNLASIIVQSGQPDFMLELLKAGYDPANWRHEELIVREDHPLNQAIKSQNPKMVQILLDADSPVAEEFYTKQGVKSPLQNAVELQKSDIESNHIMSEIIFMILRKSEALESPRTILNRAEAQEVKKRDKDKSPQK